MREQRVRPPAPRRPESPVTHSPATESSALESTVTESPVANSAVAGSPVAGSPVAETRGTESPFAGLPVALRPGGIRFPALGLGTAPLGWLYDAVDDDQATRTIHSALRNGLRYLDTAPNYGLGIAERRIGDALASDTPASDPLGVDALNVDRRGDRLGGGVILSSKVGWTLRVPEVGAPYAASFPGAPRLRAVPDFSRDGILRSIEGSLRRLRVDRLDVVYLHDVDEHEEEVYRTGYPVLAELRDQGVVRAIGVGTHTTAMPTRFVDRLDLDVVLVAGRYTLMEQGALAELLPACARRGVGVVIGGVFNSGMLANPRSGARYGYRRANVVELTRARHFERICRLHRVPLAAAALHFPFGHPNVVNVLIGMRSPDEVASNLAGFGQPVPVELWAELKDEGLLAPEVPTPAARTPAARTPAPATDRRPTRDHRERDA
jgi:D-threo-aldose 1-dehydrogenase